MPSRSTGDSEPRLIYPREKKLVFLCAFHQAPCLDGMKRGTLEKLADVLWAIEMVTTREGCEVSQPLLAHHAGMPLRTLERLLPVGREFPYAVLSYRRANRRRRGDLNIYQSHWSRVRQIGEAHGPPGLARPLCPRCRRRMEELGQALAATESTRSPVISPEGGGLPLPDTDKSGGASTKSGGASAFFGGASAFFGGASTKSGGASLVSKDGVYKDSPKGNLRAEPTLKTTITNLPLAPPNPKSGGAKVAERGCGFWGRHVDPSELASPRDLQGLFEIAFRRRPIYAANRVNFFATARSVLRRKAEGAEIENPVGTFTALVSRYRWFACQIDEDWAKSVIEQSDPAPAPLAVEAAKPVEQIANAFQAPIDNRTFEEKKAAAAENLRRAIAEGRLRR